MPFNALLNLFRKQPPPSPPQEILRAPTWYENVLLTATSPNIPQENALVTAMDRLTAASTVPAKNYITTGQASPQDVIQGLTGQKRGEWTDVIASRYPNLNPFLQKAYGFGMNVLTDPTNLIPGAMMAGEIKNVYHGSPHLFDKFSHAKIGTGEVVIRGKKRIVEEKDIKKWPEAKTEELPERTADTMSDAIALSSPSGKISKAAKNRADERLRKALFGERGLQKEQPAQPTEVESLRWQAKELRDLASRGMKPRAYAKRAAELEAQADAIEQGVENAIEGDIMPPVTSKQGPGEKPTEATPKPDGGIRLEDGRTLPEGYRIEQVYEWGSKAWKVYTPDDELIGYDTRNREWALNQAWQRIASGNIPNPKYKKLSSFDEVDPNKLREIIAQKGYFYRVHGKNEKFHKDLAFSSIIDGSSKRKGYSSYDNPEDLIDYWSGNNPSNRSISDDAEVIIYSGKKVGKGGDNEPLSVPDMKIVFRTTWKKLLSAVELNPNQSRHSEKGGKTRFRDADITIEKRTPR